MGKNMGSFDSIFDEKDDNDNKDLELWELDEESKYWIHRTIRPSLLFNFNFQNNGCPLIITDAEAHEYRNSGKEIVGCIGINEFYNDEEQKNKIMKKMEEAGLTQDDLELQIRDKITNMFQSFLTVGLYMPDVYGGDLERTAHRYSIKRMKKCINADNFGFNSNRGEWDAAVILEIPLEEEDKILETLSEPIEYGTEYYGITKISKVVSPKYIKGIVVKLGKETMYIQNENYAKNMQKPNIDEEEKDIYLYHIEDLMDEALQEFSKSSLTMQERVSKYILKTNYIYKQFRHYAMREPGFVATSRFHEVKENLNGLLFEEYESDGLCDNAYRSAYYKTVQESLNKYINDKRKNAPDDLGDSGFTR